MSEEQRQQSPLSFDPNDPEAFLPEAQKERDKAAFQDFLIAPQISGKEHSVVHRSLIPAEVVLDSGKVLEITYEDEEDTDASHQDTIIVHRREDQTIESVEIQCSCGKKFIIQFPEDITPDTNSPPRGTAEGENSDEAAPDPELSTQSESSGESLPESR